MRIGLDYRPALVNREGIGRYARELVRGMVELNFGPNLGLFGYTLARRRFGLEELGLLDAHPPELLRLRLPSRWIPWLLGRLGKGVDDLVGGCDVYHHTQPNLLAVREAVEVVTIFDTIYAIPDSGYLDPAVAQRMTEAARSMVARASRILVPCQFVGAEVVMTFGANPGRVMVTPLGCDHVVRDVPPAGYGPPATPFVLTVARVDARKNHLRMLKAFELLVKEGLPQHWVIVGPAGYGSEDFQRALASSPARERVHWRGTVSDAELPRLYAQADLLLWASLNEGFGLPPLEAMAMGTPVVTSCVTSMPEVCGDAAFLVEPTDIERIFEASRRVLSEPELAQELVSRGKRRAREYTWRETARSTLLAYQAASERDAPEPRMQGLF